MSTYAIVDIAGSQVKVSPTGKVVVPKLDSKVGTTLTFDKVLLIGDEKKMDVGTPYLQGAKIQAKVLRHLRHDTVIVLKKKKRKGYKVRNGHRQEMTEIEILNLGEPKAKHGS